MASRFPAPATPNAFALGVYGTSEVADVSSRGGASGEELGSTSTGRPRKDPRHALSRSRGSADHGKLVDVVATVAGRARQGSSRREHRPGRFELQHGLDVRVIEVGHVGPTPWTNTWLDELNAPSASRARIVPQNGDPTKVRTKVFAGTGLALPGR
jgi:hypothetical protein